jgi:hypothetical protein
MSSKSEGWTYVWFERVKNEGLLSGLQERGYNLEMRGNNFHFVILKLKLVTKAHYYGLCL